MPYKVDPVAAPNDGFSSGGHVVVNYTGPNVGFVIGDGKLAISLAIRDPSSQGAWRPPDHCRLVSCQRIALHLVGGLFEDSFRGRDPCERPWFRVVGVEASPDGRDQCGHAREIATPDRLVGNQGKNLST